MSQRILITLALSMAAILFSSQTPVEARSPGRPSPQKVRGTERDPLPGLGGMQRGVTVIVIVIVTSEDGEELDRVPFSGRTLKEARSKASRWIDAQKRSGRGSRKEYRMIR